MLSLSLASLAPADCGSEARGDGVIKETLASSTKDTSLLLQFKVDYAAIQVNGDYLRVNPWQTRKANDHWIRKSIARVLDIDIMVITHNRKKNQNEYLIRNNGDPS